MTIEKGKTLTEKVYVCDECLVLLTLRGFAKESFIIRIDTDDPVKCHICGREARFVVSPFTRGLWICNRCLNERGRKHVWMSFTVREYREDKECDICLRKGAHHIVK